MEKIDPITTMRTPGEVGTGARERIGVALTQKLLQQFGLNITDQSLLDWQDEVFNHNS